MILRIVCVIILMKTRHINSSNILLGKKNIFWFNNISYKTFMGCIRLNKIDGFYKVYDGIKYLVILGHSWSDEICDSIKYMRKKTHEVSY